LEKEEYPVDLFLIEKLIKLSENITSENVPPPSGTSDENGNGYKVKLAKPA